MVGPITKWIQPSLIFLYLSLSKLQQMEQITNKEDLNPFFTMLDEKTSYEEFVSLNYETTFCPKYINIHTKDSKFNIFKTEHHVCGLTHTVQHTSHITNKNKSVKNRVSGKLCAKAYHQIPIVSLIVGKQQKPSHSNLLDTY
jgi:hypothetical protein